jgi:hypothetical protein
MKCDVSVGGRRGQSVTSLPGIYLHTRGQPRCGLRSGVLRVMESSVPREEGRARGNIQQSVSGGYQPHWVRGRKPSLLGGVIA